MKTPIIFLFFLFICGIVNAQSDFHHNFGIKAGINISKFGQSNVNWDTRYSWHLGMLSHIHIKKHFAIQPELYFSTQGADHIIPGSDRQIHLGYLQLPVLFQYMTGTGFRFQAGPQAGFLLTAHQVLNGGARTDVKTGFNKIDFGITAGASYVTKKSFGFDARYFYGLTDISSNPTVANGNVNNLMIQLGAFYLFKHK